MSAAEDDGINKRVEAHKLVEALLDEIVCPWTVGLIVFDERNPKRAGYSRHLNVGIELLDFKRVALALYRSFGCKHTNVA